jgi:hypothetical protein
VPAGEVARRLPALATEGSAALLGLSDEELLAAWSAAMRALRDPSSPVRRRLDPLLVESTRLSAAGLGAALDVVLAGADGEGARRLFARAEPCTAPAVTLVVLASNLPGLAVQTALPALARRRPLLVKSSSAEPHFAGELHRLLTHAQPRLGSALLTSTWTGGEPDLEREVFAQVERIVVYGGAETVRDVAERAGAPVVALGPKISLGVVSRDSDPGEAACGLARDVALFDQRGCLSLQAVYTDGDPSVLAAALATALHRLDSVLPPGRPAPEEAAAVQALRLEAELRGLESHTLELAAGTVVVEPDEELLPSPGLRTVRIHPLAELERLVEVLRRSRAWLQGAALAGERAWALRHALAELGVNRFALPGELQRADASWHNGGIDPLALVAHSGDSWPSKPIDAHP